MVSCNHAIVKMPDNPLLNNDSPDQRRRHVQCRVDEQTFAALKILSIKRRTNFQTMMEDIIAAALNTRDGRLAGAEVDYEDKRMNRIAQFLAVASPVFIQSVMGIVDGVLGQLELDEPSEDSSTKKKN